MKDDFTMEVALYQPDIPQNLGAILRLCACLGVRLHVIEPCGFPMDEKRIRRAGMDYIDMVNWHRYANWDFFHREMQSKKCHIVLATTKTNQSVYDYTFHSSDVLLFGRESAGVPEEVHAAVDAKITIPMYSEARSLNVGMSAAIMLSEGLRQLRKGSKA